MRVRPLVAGLLLCGNFSIAPVAGAAETVQALRYGVSLFHFYQHEYFDALTELMVGQELQQLHEHTQGAELLRGGMSLSYGMDRVAEEIFQSSLANAAEDIDRDQAWFYLGKMAWQRNDAVRSANALQQISPEYDGELAEEANYLRAASAMRLQDDAQANDYLEALPSRSRYRYYLYYNQGAIRAAQGDWAAATAHFEQFDDMPVRSREGKALRDKAQTAAGFAHLAAGEFEQAQDAFRRVRLEGPTSDRALLGYGWSSAQLSDYQAALSPWQLLAKRSMLGASARESLLAVPYAYEQLGRPGIALDQYRVASQVYAAELEDLRGAIDAFGTQSLRSLLGVEGEVSGDWMFDADILPAGEFAPYLQYLVSRHGFQVALRELRDLYSIEERLLHAQEKLQVLEQVDDHQQEVWSALAQSDQRNVLALAQQQLQVDLQHVQQRLVVAVHSGDGRELASAEQATRWSRLERAAATADRIDTAGEQADKLQLLHGLLLWDDSETYPARVWQAQREMKELKLLSQQSSAALARVDAAIAQRTQSNFSPRIDALDSRVLAQAQQVRDVIALSEDGVRQLAVTELERQAQQMSRALGQSGLAIARLYDKGRAQ